MKDPKAPTKLLLPEDALESSFPLDPNRSAFMFSVVADNVSREEKERLSNNHSTSVSVFRSFSEFFGCAVDLRRSLQFLPVV